MQELLQRAHTNVPWMIREKNGNKVSQSKAEFIRIASENFKFQGRTGNKAVGSGSGLSQKNTAIAITNALNDPTNLTVSGLVPGGTSAGSYAVVLNVPGGKGTVNEGLGNKSFQVSFEIANNDDISAIFKDTHRIMDNLRQGNFDAEEEVVYEKKRDENGLFYQTAVANIDYVMDPDLRQFVPRARIDLYKKEDLDQWGNPKRDDDGNISVSPFDTMTVTGNQILDKMFAANMEALMATEHIEAYLQGEISKGVLNPTVF